MIWNLQTTEQKVETLRDVLESVIRKLDLGEEPAASFEFQDLIKPIENHQSPTGNL